MNREVVALFRYWMEMRSLDHSDVAKILCLSPGTLYSRFRRPETFRIEEIRAFAEFLGLKVEDFLRKKGTRII